MADDESTDIIYEDVGVSGEPIRFEILDCDGKGLRGAGEVQESTVVEILRRRGFHIIPPGTFVTVTADPLVN